MEDFAVGGVMGHSAKDVVLQKTFFQAAALTRWSCRGVQQSGENNEGAVSKGERPLRGSSLCHRQFSRL